MPGKHMLEGCLPKGCLQVGWTIARWTIASISKWQGSATDLPVLYNVFKFKAIIYSYLFDFH